jgi:tetratricopeptide (TPR) repeat protein
MKIGRNEPCPCGSGLKYKRCCWDRDRLQPPDEFVVSPRPMPEDIGNPAPDYGGKSILDDERYAPLFEEGYEAIIDRPEETVARWLELWDRLAADWKAETLPSGPDLGHDDQIVLGGWFSDLADVLMEVQQDPVLARRQAAWVEELLSLWPDWEMVTMNYANFVDLRAEALYWLGEDEEAERLFSELIAHDPDDPWPLTWWGDQFGGFGPERLRDRARAEALYEQAAKRFDAADRDIIPDRLAHLDEVFGVRSS